MVWRDDGKAGCQRYRASKRFGQIRLPESVVIFEKAFLYESPDSGIHNGPGAILLLRNIVHKAARR